MNLDRVLIVCSVKIILYSDYTEKEFEALVKKVNEVREQGGDFQLRINKISTLLNHWTEEKGLGKLLYKNFPPFCNHLVVIGEEMSDYNHKAVPRDVTHCAVRNSSKEYDAHADIQVPEAGIRGILECISSLKKYESRFKK